MKEPKPIFSNKGSDNTKHVLFLYKPILESSSEIMKYLYYEVKPPGCVEISSENAVNLSGMTSNRILKWLAPPNNVILLCISSDQTDQMPRTNFTEAELPSRIEQNIFPLCFEKEIPSQWPECYSLGLENPEKIEQANDCEVKVEIYGPGKELYYARRNETI